MGQIKNIKLHIVTDIKGSATTGSMLSRSAALRATSLLKQALRPTAISASVNPLSNNRSSSTASYITKEPKYWDTAYPSFVAYKDLAGKSAGPLFGAGLVTYLLSKEIYVVNDETMQFYVQAIVLSHLEQDLVEAASIDKFLDDRPEYYAIMQNQKEMAAEVTYRQRLQEVEAEFKKRLDYQVE